MGNLRFMLDSNILIDTLNRKLNLADFLDTLPECEIYISPVVWVETLSKPDMTVEQENAARSLLSLFLCAQLDNFTLEEAARIRRKKDLLLPDALIAASAITLNATLFSNDSHLLNFRWERYRALPVVYV